MGIRTLRYAGASTKALTQNSQHAWAQQYALKIYRANAIYSFIPKNACSTMRPSLALANGCIKSAAEFYWIHHNNATFRATLQDLAVADYTFVILRCPYARLASCFLDKFVDKHPVAWHFYNVTERTTELDQLTFHDFVHALSKPGLLAGNEHWRPQVDFLVYDAYDDYFAIEQFPKAIERLRAIMGLEVVDARRLTNHGLDRYTALLDTEDFSKVPISEIARLMLAGKAPSPRSLYTAELRERVASPYRQDAALYAEKIGGQLLF
jgi:hypothetical protein